MRATSKKRPMSTVKVVGPRAPSMHLGTHDVKSWVDFLPMVALGSRETRELYFAAPQIYAVLGKPGEKQQLDAYREWLHRVNPKAVLYYNWSGVCCRPEPMHCPNGIAPTSIFTKEQIIDVPYYPKKDDGRRFVNMTNMEAVRILSEYIYEKTILNNYDGVSLDNFLWKWAPPTIDQDQWWAGQMLLLSRLRKLFGDDYPIMVNSNVDPGSALLNGLSDFASHISYEMELHPRHILPYPEKIQGRIRSITSWCGGGKRMYSAFPYGLEYGAPDFQIAPVERSAASRMLAATLMFAREKGDGVFVHQPSMTAIRCDWYEWPHEFGDPVKPFVVSGDDPFVFSREFQRGRLTVNYRTKDVKAEVF